MAVLSTISGREKGFGVSVFRCFIFPAVSSHLQLGSEHYLPSTPARTSNNHPSSIITIFRMLSTSSVKSKRFPGAPHSNPAGQTGDSLHHRGPSQIVSGQHLWSLFNDSLCPTSTFPKARPQVARWLRTEPTTSLSAIRVIIQSSSI